MSAAGEPRRFTAEIRADDPRAIATIGSRPLPHFWPMLAAYFRDVLLPPQRRAETPVIAWSWQEPAGARALTAAELSALRKRLASDQQLLTENLESAASRAGAAEAVGGHGDLGAAMARVVAELIALPDAGLARFACRTEAGVRLHSWGGIAPAAPVEAGRRTLEISGSVRRGGKPVRRREVRLLNERGEVQARVRTAAHGQFRFSPVVPGRHRVQAAGGRTPREIAVEIEDVSVAGVDLEIERQAWRARAWLAFAAIGALVIAGGIFFLRSGAARERTTPEIAPAASIPRARETDATRKRTDGREPVRATTTPAAAVATASSAPEFRSRLAARKEEPANAAATSSAAAVSSSRDDRPRVAAAALGPGAQSGTPGNDGQPIRAPSGAPRLRVDANASSLAGEGAGIATPGIAAHAEQVTHPVPASETALTSSAAVEIHVGEPANPVPVPAHVLQTESLPRVEMSMPDASAPTPSPTLPAAASELAPTARSDPAALTRVSRVRFAPWRLEFLDDAILPTQPVRAAGREGLQALRASYLAAQRDALPRALRDSAIVAGVRVVTTSQHAVRWHWEVAGASTRVEAGSAEIVLPENPGSFAALLRADDFIVAVVSFDPEAREWSVRLAPMRVAAEWFFVAPAADEAATSRLAWRGVSGPALPAGARAEQTAAGARVLIAMERANTARALACFDRETGWALVGAIVESPRGARDE